MLNNGEAPELYYTITDHLSSIVAIADENGEIIEEQGYDPCSVKLEFCELFFHSETKYKVELIPSSETNREGQYRNPLTGTPEETPQLTMLFRGYTGHEMLPEFGLINMNGRLYDPVIARVLSPDNYVQNPYNPQNYNRYSYCYNNPLKYTDHAGDWVHLVVGGVIGGTMNLIMNANNIDNFWQGLGYFGVGAVAGALGAGVGAGINSAIAGAGFGTGFVGASTAGVSTGFFAGSMIGASSGFIGGFTSGAGNSWIQGNSFGQGLLQGVENGGIGALSGFVIGGISGGIHAKMNGKRFFDGALVENTVLIDQNIPIVNQDGDMNCLPASLEAIESSYGEDLNQTTIRGWFGGDPNTVSLDGNDVLLKYANVTGRDVFVDQDNISSLPRILTNMNNGERVVILLKYDVTDVAHSVVMKSITQQTITKNSGRVIINYIYKAMNPNGGYIMKLPSYKITGAYNILYIF